MGCTCPDALIKAEALSVLVLITGSLAVEQTAEGKNRCSHFGSKCQTSPPGRNGDALIKAEALSVLVLITGSLAVEQTAVGKNRCSHFGSKCQTSPPGRNGGTQRKTSKN
jgi:hypothetical protein